MTGSSHSSRRGFDGPGAVSALERKHAHDRGSQASAYNVKVTVRSGEMTVDVDCGLTGLGHPHLFLRSSRSQAGLLPDPGPWPVGLPWSIADRLRNGGDEKGRVLAVWQERPGCAPVPVAALAWHAHETGPLYVLDAGHTSAIDASVGRDLTMLLLHALVESAARPGASVAGDWRRVLRWSQVALKHAPHRDRQAYRRANLRRALELQFGRYQPPPSVPKWARGAWLGERGF